MSSLITPLLSQLGTECINTFEAIWSYFLPKDCRPQASMPMGISGEVLPEEIMFEILSRLPVKSLVRFSCVCKSWRYFITSNEAFARLHLNRAIRNEVLMYSSYNGVTENNDEYFVAADDRLNKARKSRKLPNPLYIGREFFVAGCCDGLMCYYRPRTNTVYLWNPALHQCRTLHQLTTVQTKELYRAIHEYYFVGFWYDSRNKDYKVVKLLCFGRGRADAHVYSLKRNSWQSVVGSCNYPAHYRDLMSRGPPLSFNGCLHWIGEASSYERAHERVIVVFNIADENLNLFEIPHSVSIDWTCSVFLGVRKGCLSFISTTGNGSVSEIWYMKTYGMANSWTRADLICEELVGSCSPIGFSAADGKILFLQKPRSVFSYDPEGGSKGSKLFDLIGEPSSLYHYFVADYVESLVSVIPPPLEQD